jgi:hypothetical protein
MEISNQDKASAEAMEAAQRQIDVADWLGRVRYGLVACDFEGVTEACIVFRCRADKEARVLEFGTSDRPEMRVALLVEAVKALADGVVRDFNSVTDLPAAFVDAALSMMDES